MNPPDIETSLRPTCVALARESAVGSDKTGECRNEKQREEEDREGDTDSQRLHCSLGLSLVLDQIHEAHGQTGQYGQEHDDGEHLEDKTVLDYGCGSGILAIAALKLGARSACGVDIDPQALLATADNATGNNVEVPCFNVGKAPEGPYDVVLANILAGPLVELATQLSEYVKTGGRLALSGILEEQAASVRKAYEPFIVFDADETMFQDGQTWVRLSGTRRTI